VPLPTEDDYIDAVQTLADFLGPSGFPKGATARTLIVRYLQKFIESKEALDWLLEAAVEQISDWRDAGGMAKLRGIYSQKYRPLDQVEEPEFVPMSEVASDQGWSKPVHSGSDWMTTLPEWCKRGYDWKLGRVKDPIEDRQRKEREANNVRAAMLDIMRAQQERQTREESNKEPEDEPNKTADDPEEDEE
jgi:hypothetical protein